MRWSSSLHVARRRVLACSLALPLAACGQRSAGGASPAPTTLQAQPAGAGALAPYAALTVIVLPTQGGRPGDSTAWRTAGGERRVVAMVDSAVEAAFVARGLGRQWVFPPALARAARRNPTYVSDPATLRALAPVRAALRRRDEPMTEPFASQLRALAGVSDARYAFIPLEVRAEPILDGATTRLVLQAAVVDARGSRVAWLGEVRTEGAPQGTALAPAAIASLAARVAELVVPPQ